MNVKSPTEAQARISLRQSIFDEERPNTALQRQALHAVAARQV